MSIREELAEEIYEKFKVNTYFIQGYYQDHKISTLYTQLLLEDYKCNDTPILIDLKHC